MFLPALQTRIEKRHDFVGVGVNAGEVGAFMAITVRTRQGEIRCIVDAAMLTGANMLDVKPKERRCRLRQSTILAAVLRPTPDEITQRRVHYRFAPGNSRRALA